MWAEDFYKEHPSLKNHVVNDPLFFGMMKGEFENKIVMGTFGKNGDFCGEFITVDRPFSFIDDIHKTHIDKQKVMEAIDRINDKLIDVRENLNEEKLKGVENFGNSQRDYKEKGFMRWAFEDGAVEALLQLKNELGLE